MHTYFVDLIPHKLGMMSSFTVVGPHPLLVLYIIHTYKKLIIVVAKSDKRSSKEKERLNIVSRPFQKLPAPFELNEHHTMHRHTILPIAIYEKEHTSIIAYALGSRDYAARLKSLMTDQKHSVGNSTGAAGVGGSAASTTVNGSAGVVGSGGVAGGVASVGVTADRLSVNSSPKL